MSAPRTKRQFAGAASDPAQCQITSFFSKTSTGSGSSGSINSSTISAVASPLLPAHVQANLLSVGMRVRKSVPDGYKTGSSYGSFSLWKEADFKTLSSAPLPPTTADIAPGSVLSSRRELLPFCGIHKVGGLAVQPETAPDLDDIPGLTSSQDSIISTNGSSDTEAESSPRPPPLLTSSTTINRKRIFSNDDVDSVDVPTSFAVPFGLGVWREHEDWLSGEVSPRSHGPAGWENARVMAVPRRRGKKGATMTGIGDVSEARLPFAELGQENLAVDDFDEAEFLDCRHEAEMVVE